MNMNIKERVLLFAKNQQISLETFFSEIGMTYGSFKGVSKEKSLNSDAIAKILTIYPEINPHWLLLGKGEMLLKGQTFLEQEENKSLEFKRLFLELLQDKDVREALDMISKINYDKQWTDTLLNLSKYKNLQDVIKAHK